MLSALGDRYTIHRSESPTYLGVKFDQSMVFEHEDGMFKVIEWGDRDNPNKMECNEIIAHPKCQFVLKCQYNPKWHIPKLRPYFYFEKTKPKQFSGRLDRLRSLPKCDTPLYWRGNMHLGRDRILGEMKDLLNCDFAERATLDDYYEEMASHQVALSLPGLGNHSHREYEAFAVGTVVLAPRFVNINHAPLIPNVHYLCSEGADPLQLRARLAATTKEELMAIRKNAMDYYDKYIRYDASVLLLEHLLEL